VLNHKCPVCGSRNTAYGLAHLSRNVSFVCNACNFRDIVFYADTPAEAETYWKATREPRSKKVSKLRVFTGRKVSKLRVSKYGEDFPAGRNGMAILQELRQRVLIGGTMADYRAVEMYFMRHVVPCKH